jgi:hypothetical protein
VERREQDGWVEWDANSWFGAWSGELTSRQGPTGVWLASHMARFEAVHGMVRMEGAWTEPDYRAGRAASPVISSILARVECFLK